MRIYLAVCMGVPVGDTTDDVEMYGEVRGSLIMQGFCLGGCSAINIIPGDFV